MKTIRSVTVGIPVRDLGEAIAWYRQLVGRGEELEPAPGVWELELMPSVWLQLFEQAPEGTNPSILRFEAERIEASHDHVTRLCDDVGAIQDVAGAVRYFEFQDPFGNQLSFYQLLDDL